MLDNSNEINDLLAMVDGNFSVDVFYPNALDEIEFDDLISPLLKLYECKKGYKCKEGHKLGLIPNLIGDSARIQKSYTFSDEEKSNNFVSSINNNKDFKHRGISARIGAFESIVKPLTSD